MSTTVSSSNSLSFASESETSLSGQFGIAPCEWLAVYRHSQIFQAQTSLLFFLLDFANSSYRKHFPKDKIALDVYVGPRWKTEGTARAKSIVFASKFTYMYQQHAHDVMLWTVRSQYKKAIFSLFDEPTKKMPITVKHLSCRFLTFLQALLDGDLRLSY